MQTSRFQLGLIATLAVGLGFSLSSSEAIGYPAGPVISFGTNPVWNMSDTVPSNTTADIITAPVGQDIMVTDVSFGAAGPLWFTLQLDDGTQLAYRKVTDISDRWERSLQSPLLVPAGSTLSVSNCNCGAAIFYTLSGYYAQP